MFAKYLAGLLFCVTITAMQSQASAETLGLAVFRTIATYPEIKAQINRRSAREHELRQAESGYYPSVDLLAAVGNENSKNRFTFAAGHADYVDLTRKEEAFVVTYNVFNGFATSSNIDSNTAKVTASGHRLHNLTEQTALQVANAYLRVIQYQQLVTLSKDTLAEHEQLYNKVKSRSQSGVGRKSDINHAMGRVARARANLIADQASLQNAEANYVRITGEMPVELSSPDDGEGQLPSDLQDAIKQALQHNPLLKAAEADRNEAQAQKREARSGYYPRLDLVFEQSRGENLDGIVGVEKDYSLMLKMRYNLFSGGYDAARAKQALSQLQESNDSLENIRRQVTENTQLAWNAYQSIQRQLPYLVRYVKSITATRSAYSDQFKIGQRSLLDLLDSENELYQAHRSRIIAEYDRLYGGYRILANMGKFVDMLEAARTKS